MRTLAPVFLALMLAGGVFVGCSTPQQNGTLNNPTPTASPTTIPSPTPAPTATPTAVPTPRIRPTPPPSPTPTPIPMIPIAEGTVWTLREDFPENPNQRDIFVEAGDMLNETMFTAIQPDAWYLSPSIDGTFHGSGAYRAVAVGKVWFVTWYDGTCVRNCDMETLKKGLTEEAGPHYRGTERLFYSLEGGELGTWVEFPPPSAYGPTRLALRGEEGQDGLRVFDGGERVRFIILAVPPHRIYSTNGPIYETVVLRAK